MKNYINFNFHMYTENVFGKDTENRTGEMVKKYGGSKVLIVYGGGSVKRSGLFDRVTASLDKAGIKYTEFGGVKANPTRSLAYKAIEFAKKEKIDFVLGLGGGSAIDTAKVVALAMVYDGDVWDLFSGWDNYSVKLLPAKMMPVGTIHTLSSTGTENSGAVVIVDDVAEIQKKVGTMWPDVARPVFAIMNPELTYSVPVYQKAAGAVDAFSHTLERYFQHNTCSLADEFSFALLRNVIKYGKATIDNPTDYESHAEMMLNASFAHNDVTGLGRTPGGYSVHGLEVTLSGRFDTTHGAGIGLIIPPWLTYIVNHSSLEDAMRVAQLAVQVFGVMVDMSDPRRVALEGIQRIREWLRSLGMPLTLTELGVKNSPEDLAKYARNNSEGILPGFLHLDKKAVTEIFASIK